MMTRSVALAAVTSAVLLGVLAAPGIRAGGAGGAGGEGGQAVQLAAPQPPTQTPSTIQWMDWTDKAFARATAENKPILLHVRALWSRSSLWAEEVTFTDPAVVKLVNEHWVPVRVDRDRRPDIDMRYQVAVNAVVPGEAGWPMTAFLFDNGDVLFGSSFISLNDRINKPGLRSLLAKTAEFYSTDRDKAAGTREVVKMAFQRELTPVREPDYSIAYLEGVTKDMVTEVDQEHGGFGDTSRVPMLYTLELAGTVYHRIAKQEILDVLIKSLNGMERGAIFDRVGGGFHRAVTDTSWRVPEFEKLLSYNAPLLVDYLMGYEITGDTDMKNAAESILSFLLGTLRDPGGGFYLGQWAASKSEEPRGTYYTWTDEEFKKAIPPDQVRLAHVLFNVTPEGDVALGPPARSLIYLGMGRKEAADRLGVSVEQVRKGEAEIVAALARARAARTAPPIEKAIYVDSSSSGAIAMFEAWRVLGRKDALEAGVAALDRLIGAATKSPTLLHRLVPPPEPGVDPTLAMDHLMLAKACLAGYETTGEARYLAAARDIVSRAMAQFWGGDGVGFFDVVDDPNAKGYLTVRRQLPNDTAYPALNSLAARVLARLTLLTGDPTYRQRGEICLKQLAARTKELNYRMGGLGLALDAYLRVPSRYVVVGGRSDPKTEELRVAALRLFDPGKIVVKLIAGIDDQEISRLKLKRTDSAYVVVCRAEKCSEPAMDAAALKQRASGPDGAALNGSQR